MLVDVVAGQGGDDSTERAVCRSATGDGVYELPGTVDVTCRRGGSDHAEQSSLLVICVRDRGCNRYRTVKIARHVPCRRRGRDQFANSIAERLITVWEGS